ncbi:Proliferating cell nuclear antigen [Armadillidium vulgare iridescent virus]|uniref:Proliferating cell nuclear antigen n=1 Tax=Armadillidium vulgare iridescent virus TaxID=72201 RepID=A0A068QL26_9VIRU|nr:Proliferating cell nuclear antigen [Armadillidium vulgare iridescent virus]CCV02558.1 Proliferating cell nuclear antigen [Armadillidium vulgare iridescent virus]
MTEETIFEAYLSESANIFKHLIELFSQVAPIKKSDNSNKSIKQAFFKITKNGIYINIDYESDILINAVLNAGQFDSYKYNFPVPELNIGVAIDILKKFLKTVKKNEGVSLCINKKPDQTMPNKISFSISSPICDSITVFSINVNIVQNIKINATVDGQELKEINSEQFTNVCKLMSGSKSQIKVIANTSKTDKPTIVFSRDEFNMGDVWRAFPLKIERGFEIDFTNYYKSEYFKTILKLSSFDKTIKISYVDDTIGFKSRISKNSKSDQYIGTISIWIKSEDPPKKEDCSDDDDY